MSYPDSAAVRGADIARAHGKHRWLYPTVNIWEWVRHE